MVSLNDQWSVPQPPGATVISPSYSDRACTAEDTLRRITPFLPRYGITRVSRLTGLDTIGVPVWSAVSPNARSIAIHHGKGITDAEARVSATMEALERAVAGNPPIETVTATRTSLLAAGNVVESLNSLIGHGQTDITDGETIDWVCGFDVLSRVDVWVPRDAVLLDRTSETARFWQSSDGLASGNTLEEAIFHGVLERIERDAEALWNIAAEEQRLATCCDPLSFQDPIIDQITGRIDGAGLTLRLFDISSDIGVACFAALLAPVSIGSMNQARFVDVTKGSGAHPDPVRATIRAMTEAIQSRLTYISGARDDIYPETFARPLSRELQNLFSARPLPRPFLKGAGSETLELMFANVLQRLRMRNIGSAIVVPLTPPGFPFAVAKIFVPDLENPKGDRKRRFGTRAISKALFST
jgi:YcaO-like protein with predicted kinase domain